MHWVMPAMMVPGGARQLDLPQQLHAASRRMPLRPRSAACGTEEIPRWVRRIGAGNANITVEMRPGTTPSPNSTRSGSDIRTSARSASDRAPGRIAAYSRGRCAAAIPSGTPMSAEAHGRDHDQRERLERRVPVALIQDEEQRQHHEYASAPTERRSTQASTATSAISNGRGQCAQQRGDSVDRAADDDRDAVEQQRAVRLDQSIATVMASPTGILWLTTQSSKPPARLLGIAARAQHRRDVHRRCARPRASSWPTSRCAFSHASAAVAGCSCRSSIAAIISLSPRRVNLRFSSSGRRSGIRCGSPCGSRCKRWRRRSSRRIRRRRRRDT